MTFSHDLELYDAVVLALSELRTDVEAAESHGMLCGMLCSPEPFDADAWLRHLLGYSPTQRMEELPQTSALLNMMEATLHGLEAEDYALELLLPAEEEPLAARADALGAWCRGFLSGFGLHGAGANLNAEGREFLRDLYKISQVASNEASDEEGERAFIEVVEYTRMGAMMLHEEYRSLFADRLPSLH